MGATASAAKKIMSGNQALYSDFMSQGHSAAWEIEWDKAASFYQQALSELPGDSRALSYLASAQFELQEFDNALSSYQKVAETSPDDPLPLEKIAQILEHQKRFKPGAEVALRAAEMHLRNRDIDKAIENWTRCITLNPEHLRARSRLAMTYEQLDRIPQAVNQYLVVASLLQHAGSKEKAIELVDHIIEIMPDSAEAQHALGLLRANQLLPKPAHKTSTIGGSLIGRSRDGPDLLDAPSEEISSDIDPIADARQRALSVLASLMFEQPGAPAFDETNDSPYGQMPMGTGPLSRATVEHSTIILYLTQAVDFQTRKEDSKAAESLEQALEAGLDNAAAYFDLGYLQASSGHYESALRNLQSSAKHSDYALASRLLMAQTFHNMDRFPQSAVQYLEALRLADSMVVGGQEGEAIQQMYEPLIDAYTQEKDLEVHRKLAVAIENMLQSVDWRDKISKAREQLPAREVGMSPVPVAELLTEAQNSVVVEIMSRIMDLARRGLHRPAMEEAFQALHHAPAYLPLHTIMGDILLQQDHLEESIAKFNVVARAYSARGETVRSIDIYRRITRLAPLDLAARHKLIEQLTAAGLIENTLREQLDLGDVYYRLAELDQARSSYEKALNLARQSGANDEWTIEILHHLADIDMQRLDWRRALRLFDQILSFAPGDNKAATNKIGLHFRMNDDNDALASLGNHVDFLNRNDEVDQAVVFLEDLLAGYPDKVPVQSTLAEQYQLQGRLTDAIRQWDKVSDRLIDQGDRPGAIRALRALLSLSPENQSDYEQVLKELESKED